MMRTEGMTSSRSQTAAASINEVSIRGFTRRTRRRPIKDRLARRELLALPVALALLVPAAPALAQASTATAPGTSGYKQTAPPPKTTPEPKKEVEPAKEEKKTTPTTTPEPTTTTPTAKASTLPFTGLDLRWVVGAGLILLASGLSIRLALRGRPGAGR
jgi:uncharacterized membrane protein